ncbi:MAG TPA: chromosomal replication initiator protein DnaA, partial [Solirubrobacterales bacterium]|nr:chromosomal replication initiator protein DnaA [Solirubrobacterales bacterium]
IDSIGFVPDAAAAAGADAERSRSGSLPLEPGHVFERFVIGPGNRLAHAAALAVAELPGDAYNPLFLHGPPGLGKTHLLGAIAAYMHENHPGLTIHHTTAERFTAEFVTALRHDGPERFKARYRELDALLIDDVQVLEGKERTQEEFVHTFNALHGAGKQIVLSSDRPPQALSRLEERLRDRFEWGLCVAIEPPDIRTRLALAWRLAASGDAEPPGPEVLREIAARVPANVRLLEGAITRVLAFASMLGEPLQPALVHRALGVGSEAGSAPGPPATQSVEAIQDAVCSVLDVSREELLSARRTPRIARARQLAMYIAREQTSHSLTEIARRFDRDHTTVVHAIRAVTARLEPGSDTADELRRVRLVLGDSPRPESANRRPDPDRHR